MEASCWSDERQNRLATLVKAGKSFSLIANELGVTRSAAIGKAHRMKLPSRTPIECLPRPRSAVRQKRARVRAAIVKKEKVKPVIVPDRNYRCSIIELTNETCRYPLWPTSAPESERFYCGVPQADISSGVPYCEQHSMMCGSPRQT